MNNLPELPPHTILANNLLANSLVVLLPLAALVLCSFIKKTEYRRILMLMLIFASGWTPSAYSYFASTAAAMFAVAAVLHEWRLVRKARLERNFANP